MAVNDDLKVYTPEVIMDTPLPGEEIEQVKDSSSGVKEIYGPSEIPDQTIPTKRISHELISQSLNTKSKKILGEFQFTQSGALQIGKYEEAVSGDVRISPNGITARDSSGNTTFALDGETGDATFKGTVQVGSLIAGDGNIAIERASNGNGRIVFYNNGLPSIIIGDPS